MQNDDMNCGLTVAERDRLQSTLKNLPDTMPPRVVWQRIEQQARAEGLVRRPPVSEKTRWIAGSGIAAAVVLAVLNFPATPGTGENVLANEPMPTVPAYQQEEIYTNSINALMVKSQVLERDLRRMPASPQLMRASTAATIDDLQSRIAAIDYQLNHPGVRMTRREQEVYWRERVRLMDSLLQLRYAQMRRGSF